MSERHRKRQRTACPLQRDFFLPKYFSIVSEIHIKGLVQCKQNFLGSTFPALCRGQMCTLMILLLLHCLALPCTDDRLCCTRCKCCAKGLLNCAHLNIEHWVQVLCGTKVCKFYAKRFQLKCAHHSEIRRTLCVERPFFQRTMLCTPYSEVVQADVCQC